MYKYKYGLYINTICARRRLQKVIIGSDLGVISFFKKGNILFLGSQMDNIEYGCGGLIRRMVEAGLKDRITFLIITQNIKSSSEGKITIQKDFKEVYEATALLGLAKENICIKEISDHFMPCRSQEIAEILSGIRLEFKPSYVFFPSKSDIHQFNKSLYEEAISMFRNNNCFGYELVRNCYHFQPNFYVEIGPSILERKIAAAMSYKSQLVQSTGYFFNPEVLKAVSQYRGAQSEKNYAEAYEIYYLHL